MRGWQEYQRTILGQAEIDAVHRLIEQQNWRLDKVIIGRDGERYRKESCGLPSGAMLQALKRKDWRHVLEKKISIVEEGAQTWLIRVIPD